MATLVSLPPELIGCIADHAHPSDLFGLRQTSRYISLCVNDTFAARFFVDRVHLYTQHGLEALWKISSTKHLRKKLASIQILVPDSFLRDPDVKHMTGVLADLRAQNILSPAIYRAALLQDSLARKNIIDAQLSSLFEETLRQLKRHGIIPSISVQTYDLEPTLETFKLYHCAPFGHAKLQRLLSMEVFAFMNINAQQTWPRLQEADFVVLSSIAAVRFPVTKLSLCEAATLLVQPDDQFVKRSIFFAHLDRAISVDEGLDVCLAHLDSLSVTLRLDTLSVTNFPYHQGMTWDLVYRTLLGGLRMTKLVATFVRTNELAPIAEQGYRLGLKLMPTNLQSLTLKQGNFSLEDLLHLFEFQKDSLSQLTLIEIGLPTLLSWYTCLWWIAHNMHLTSICIQQMEMPDTIVDITWKSDDQSELLTLIREIYADLGRG